jgi:hypothetical protein
LGPSALLLLINPQAATFLAVVYDHVITIGQEVRTIWNNPSVHLHSKAAFVINRYLSEGVFAYVVYSESGELFTAWCAEPSFLQVFSGTGTGLTTTVSFTSKPLQHSQSHHK